MIVLLAALWAGSLIVVAAAACLLFERRSQRRRGGTLDFVPFADAVSLGSEAFQGGKRYTDELVRAHDQNLVADRLFKRTGGGDAA